MDRRTFIQSSLFSGASMLMLGDPIFSSVKKGFDPQGKTTALFTLPDLPYAYDALEPYIDTMTMEIHHSRHHGAYVANLNKAADGAEWVTKPLVKILDTVSNLPAPVRNNAGGHYNHTMFWKWMKPKGGGEPTGELMTSINRDFGTFENFKEQFTNAGMTRFGSGWAWLVKQHDKLVIASTPNQDNPLMDAVAVKGTPILGLDVWEHAYYLKYQYRRADYIAAWWKVVNWNEAARLFGGSK